MLSVFTAGIVMVVIGLTMGLCGIVAKRTTYKRLMERCTATTQGVYTGPKTKRIAGNESIQYETAKFVANGYTWTAKLGHTQGIGIRTKVNAPLIVHYDPEDPGFCWASTPEAENKGPRMLEFIIYGGLVATAVGALLILVTFIVGAL